ncbi:MAG: NupC/NupG family nucleoside CNT transporter, partial [Flavobacteriia bacterium]|nr:NupC/NupG family nucleoside CNT transporter [Flavobacteriia bacterium]
MEILRALASLVLLLGILFLASTNRRAISWPLVVKGLLIQFGLA